MKLIEQSENAYINNSVLNKHMQFYNQNGYLIIKNTISNKSIEKFISSTLKIFILQAKKCGYNSIDNIKDFAGDKVDAMDSVVGYLLQKDRHAFDEANKILSSLFSPILISMFIYNTQPELINNTILIFTKLIIEKVNSGSFESRTGKDLLAFAILPSTYFLGIGAGSHRSGSLMGYILSNTGLPGIILFLYFLTMLVLITISNKEDKDIAVCSSAFFGFILAKSIAGPGVADDILWFTLILLLASLNKQYIYNELTDYYAE